MPSQAQMLARFKEITMHLTIAVRDNLTSQTEVRDFRNGLLLETDQWATLDRPDYITMTAEQTAYRQALRDITDQAGFPHDITWPTKPE